eukprot:1156231-Pelagomonas_calceolata.AAC.2
MENECALQMFYKAIRDGNADSAYDCFASFIQHAAERKEKKQKKNVGRRISPYTMAQKSHEFSPPQMKWQIWSQNTNHKGQDRAYPWHLGLMEYAEPTKQKYDTL